jgi:hypothetical protein
LRARVVRAAAAAVPVPIRQARRWGLVWRAAAVIVLALNLGMSAANGVRFQRLNASAQERPNPVAAVEVDDPFQALAARALANWTPAPDTGTVRRIVFSTKEERGWDMP